MKKILSTLLVFICVSSTICYGQSQPYYAVYNFGNSWQRGAFYTSLIIPLQDTVRNSGDTTRAGDIVMQPTTYDVYGYNGTYWERVGCCVSSVSNNDGSLTISPTTGDVISSINLGHTNTWTIVQVFNNDLITTAPTDGLRLTNAATATGGSPIRASPSLNYIGAAYLSGSSTVAGVRSQYIPLDDVQGGSLRWDGNLGGVYTNSLLTLNSVSGNLAALGAVSGTGFVAGANSGTTGTIQFFGTTSGVVTLGVQDGAGTYAIKLPSEQGDANSFIRNDGLGNLNFSLIDVANVTGILAPGNGGTGIANNAASTWTISGNFATTVTVTEATTITLPPTGTLYGTAVGSITSAQLAASLSNETGFSTGALAVFSISPALTGSPTAPTQSAGDNSTKIATTAYVDVGFAALSGATFTGNVIIPKLVVNNQTGTTYTTELGDAGKWVTSNNGSAVTFTIPTNAAVAYPTNTYISFANYGAGALTIAPDGGVTINGTDANRKFVQYAEGYIHKTGTDTWIIGGKTSN